MKLRITCAAALFAFAGAAHAQSSVTLYGVVDSGLLYQSTSASYAAAPFLPNTKINGNAGHVVQLKDGGIYSSIFGMKGSEDLGGGYAANFKLQGAFNSSNGQSGKSDTPTGTSMFTQVTTVGVSGPFGKVDFGRQFAPMAYAMAETDVRNAQYFGSVLTAWLTMNTMSGWTGSNTNGQIGALYDDNAIVYNSPSFYGVSAALEFAPGGVAGQAQGGTRESAVLKYSGYGLNADAVYYNGHDANPYSYAAAGNPATATTGIPATGLNNNRFVYFGAKYTWHGISVSGSFSNGRNPANSNGVPKAFVVSGDFDMWTGGLGYRFSPALNFTSGVYYLKDNKNNSNQSTAYAIGADYGVSKRTLVYAQAGYVSNRGQMNQELIYGTPVAPGKNTTAFNIGLRHTF
ncbi:Outer membrane porin protein 32 [Paraburkholderia caffeinitolerans]|uniref:Outer membrane porin protein 32 n=1 Tax=Paraburkholderia caffeinitolerans TaxID=1723730 RepID=A0A6J5GS49_9BURK|nr:porin [Paraburkholderia caffeinitolerans]CAB3802735.1 Outer membrane porin protein 32 [Paraburkholderia caffeinitolerans]